jgi:hypothetical protein
MEYIQDFNDYKIYKGNGLFYAMKSQGKKEIGNQVYFTRMKKIVSDDLSSLLENLKYKDKEDINDNQLSLF